MKDKRRVRGLFEELSEAREFMSLVGIILIFPVYALGWVFRWIMTPKHLK